MSYKEFKRRVIAEFYARYGHDAVIENIVKRSENSCDLYVLEGGYEPARISAYLEDGDIKFYYR